MNKIIYTFGLFLTLCLVACGGKTEKTGATDSLQADTDTIGLGDVEMDEVSPEATVDFYYKEIVQRYMEDHQTSQLAFVDFCSAELKQLLKDANKHKRIYHDDGPFDFDMWINAKVFDNLSVKNIEQYNTEDGTTEVEVTLRNTGQENKVYVILVNENGLWMVDDFRYVDGNKTTYVKPLLKEYLEK